ncbi:uncharacterized protein K452DRAFT_283050 [Aplosporella prunicola CBS 121167]|uniref:Uncharacterized protein n=1 Tax=Aplosporella prunicola CBS 121167 TaxID=1176127 RepID=A0A6A6BUA0_9PEZI|nr:uncharacterized protein K452DRAFT_283050 [Aplosporella prunicola CBS 121167]KAF2146845.1 hypothetical protein K452DRAFT_283050 [Aplosporella prunicola CBS 121167]
MAAASTASKGLQYSRMVEARFRTISTSSASSSSSSSYPRALLSSPDEAEPARASSRPPRPPARRFHSHPPPAAPSHSAPAPPPVRSFYAAAADSPCATMRLSLHHSPPKNHSDSALGSPLSPLPPLPPSPYPPSTSTAAATASITSAPAPTPEESAYDASTTIADDTASFVTRVKRSSPWTKSKEKRTSRREIRDGKRPSEDHASASGLWEARAEMQRVHDKAEAHRVSLKRVIDKLRVRRDTGASDELHANVDDESCSVDAVSVQSADAAVLGLGTRRNARPASIHSTAVESGSEDELDVDAGFDPNLDPDIDALLEDGLLHPLSRAAVKRRTASAQHATHHQQTLRAQALHNQGGRTHTRHRSHDAPPPPLWDADHPNPAFAAQAPLDIRVGPEIVALLDGACGSDWPTQLERLCLDFVPPPGVPSHAAQLIRACKTNGRAYRIVAQDFRPEAPAVGAGDKEGGFWTSAVRRTRAFL